MTTPYSFPITGATGAVDLDALATALAPKVAAILNATPAPPVDPPPPSTAIAYVYHDGTFYWPGDYSWGVQVEYSDSTGAPLSGAFDIEVMGNGGWQPYAANQDFDTTPYKYLYFWVKPTLANAVWGSGVMAKGDVPVGTNLSDISKFAVSAQGTGAVPLPNEAGAWTQYRIPLGAGGLNLPAGQHIEKFWIQDRSNNGNGTDSNRWYVDEAYFSAT